MNHSPIVPNNTGKKYNVRTTARQRKFAELIVKGRSAYGAALEAGYSKATARNPNRNIVEKHGFQDVIQQLPGAHIVVGNTPMEIARSITELLRAQKTIVVGKEKRTVPNYAARIRGVELWLKSLSFASKYKRH